MGIQTQRLSASHIKLGRPLPGDVYDEHGHLLLSSGFVVASASQLEALLSRGLYVDIATFQAHFGNAAGAPAPEARRFDPFLLRDSLKKRLNRALRGLGREPDAVGQIKEIAAAVHELADTDPEGAVAAGLLDGDHSYSIRHSVLTAILCDLASTALDWPAGKRSSLVCAAIRRPPPASWARPV